MTSPPDWSVGPIALSAAIVERAQLDVLVPPTGHEYLCDGCGRLSDACAVDYLAAVRSLPMDEPPDGLAHRVLAGLVGV